jgi:hypothetical protein
MNHSQKLTLYYKQNKNFLQNLTHSNKGKKVIEIKLTCVWYMEDTGSPFGLCK